MRTVDDLIARWTSAAERLGAQNDVRVEGERLIASYGRQHRRYHDLAHLETVLKHVDGLEIYAKDADAVRVAAWFHDAVYDADRDDNETASAALAQTVLDRLDVEDEVAAEVSRLVRLTSGHDPAPDDRDGHVLCDADLAVLGSSQADYISYAAAIRLEYAHVPDDAFAEARSQVLRALLERPRIYGTPTARTTWEAAARKNISQELSFLAVPSDDAGPRP